LRLTSDLRRRWQEFNSVRFRLRSGRLPQQAAAGKVLRQLAKPTDVSNIQSIFILEHRACSSRAFFVLVMEILEAGCAFGTCSPILTVDL